MDGSTSSRPLEELVRVQLDSGLGELRDLARGIHPSVGGRLEVESAPGEGTCMRATLPYRVLGSLNGS